MTSISDATWQDTLHRQAEWEAYVTRFKGCPADARSDEKWQRMDKIFDSGSDEI